MPSSLLRTWVPGPVVRQNLCIEPSFEVAGGSGRWSPDGAATLRTTDAQYVGAYSWRITPAGAFGGVAYSMPTIVDASPYTVSAWVLSPTARTVRIREGFSSTVSAPVALVAGVWTRIHLTFVSAGTAASIQFQSPVSLAPFYLDAVLIEAGSDLNDYFDGGFTSDSGPGYVYTWEGDPHLSASLKSALVAEDTPTEVVPPVLTSHRLTRFIYEWLNKEEDLLGLLDGVAPGGRLTWNAGARIKGGGTIEMRDTNQQDSTGSPFNWLNDRIRISIDVNGITWPLGVWIPTAPVSNWSKDSVSWSVELHDKLTILDTDLIQTTFSLPEGTVVTDAVRERIESAGEFNHLITASAATLSQPQVWLTGTSKLTIINDLLSSINYFALRTNGLGAYVAVPYQAPADRPMTYEFVDGVTAIYTPEFTVDYDLFNVPNVVIAIMPGDDTAEGLSAVAINDNADSPFSTVNRGRDITKVYDSVEVEDQAALQAYAERRLLELSIPARNISIAHGPVPLVVLDRVRFRSEPAEIDSYFIVNNVEVVLDATVLATANLRSVNTFVGELDEEEGALVL